MRPYITVILDSFHEAFASRILYILLMLLTLVLVSIAPFGYEVKRSVSFDRLSFRDLPALLTKIGEQAKAGEASPGKHLLSLANSDFKKVVDQFAVDQMEEGDEEDRRDAQRDRRKQFEATIKQLNSLLDNPKLYDAAAWEDVNLDDDTKEMLTTNPAKLSEEELQYRNRKLLQAAYPMFLGPISSEQIYMNYSIWTFPEPIPFDKATFSLFIKQILATFMDFFVGFIAIFVAVLVTAPIIPRTFEAGAIDLLLSKPISRSMLLIAKYIGGCAFILLNATYFIVGLWLIVGLRLDVWSQKLLLCIPIFLFQFAIYYAVSTLAGVVWKNSIVSISITVLFFLACFSVGMAKGLVEQIGVNPSRLVRIVSTDEGMIGVTQGGQFVEWNQDETKWEEVLQSNNSRRGPGAIAMQSILAGPVYHEPSQKMLYLQIPSGEQARRMPGSGSRFFVAQWDGTWKSKSGPSPPTGASWILQDKRDHILIVAAAGIFVFDVEDQSEEGGANFLGFKLPIGGSRNKFNRIGPDRGVPYFSPIAAALEPESSELLIASKGKLLKLNFDEKEGYLVNQQLELESKEPVLLGLTSEHAILAKENGQIEIRSAKNLEVQKTLRPASNSPPAGIEVSEDGRLIAVVFHNGRLWVYDTQADQGRFIDSDASAVTFIGQSMLVVDNKTRVRSYSTDGFELEETFDPVKDTLRWYYDWLIEPIYFVFPKPGELSVLIKVLLTDDSTTKFSQGSEGDLRELRVSEDYISPVVHSAIFIVVILGITCIYVSRLDL